VVQEGEATEDKLNKELKHQRYEKLIPILGSSAIEASVASPLHDTSSPHMLCAQFAILQKGPPIFSQS
jgi:hypothetical protein